MALSSLLVCATAAAGALVNLPLGGSVSVVGGSVTYQCYVPLGAAASVLFTLEGAAGSAIAYAASCPAGAAACWTAPSATGRDANGVFGPGGGWGVRAAVCTLPCTAYVTVVPAANGPGCTLRAVPQGPALASRLIAAGGGGATANGTLCRLCVAWYSIEPGADGWPHAGVGRITSALSNAAGNSDLCVIPRATPPESVSECNFYYSGAVAGYVDYVSVRAPDAVYRTTCTDPHLLACRVYILVYCVSPTAGVCRYHLNVTSFANASLFVSAPRALTLASPGISSTNVGRTPYGPLFSARFVQESALVTLGIVASRADSVLYVYRDLAGGSFLPPFPPNGPACMGVAALGNRGSGGVLARIGSSSSTAPGCVCVAPPCEWTVGVLSGGPAGRTVTLAVTTSIAVAEALQSSALESRASAAGGGLALASAGPGRVFRFTQRSSATYVLFALASTGPSAVTLQVHRNLSAAVFYGPLPGPSPACSLTTSGNATLLVFPWWHSNDCSCAAAPCVWTMFLYAEYGGPPNGARFSLTVTETLSRPVQCSPPQVANANSTQCLCPPGYHTSYKGALCGSRSCSPECGFRQVCVDAGVRTQPVVCRCRPPWTGAGCAAVAARGAELALPVLLALLVGCPLACPLVVGAWRSRARRGAAFVLLELWGKPPVP